MGTPVLGLKKSLAFLFFLYGPGDIDSISYKEGIMPE